MAYYRPESLAESLEILADRKVAIVAGATDLYPAKTTRNAQGDWQSRDMLDLWRLKVLRGIHEKDDHYAIGALTTWSELLRAELPGYFHTLKQAAANIGHIQIQNRATIVGNVCNASPAADGVPPLLTLNARVALASKRGRRVLSLADFLLGNRSTAIAADEIATELRIPKLPITARSGFHKLGVRRYLVISIAMVAAVLDVDEDDVIREARVAVGSCSEVAQRMSGLERDLVGLVLDENLRDAISAQHFAGLTPVDDIRADAHYRRTAAVELTRQLLDELV